MAPQTRSQTRAQREETARASRQQQSSTIRRTGSGRNINQTPISVTLRSTPTAQRSIARFPNRMLLLPASQLLYDPFRVMELLQFLSTQLDSSSSSSDEDAYNEAVNQYNAERDARNRNALNLESKNPFQCTICMTSYRDREPTAVKCGHVYCRQCIELHFQNANSVCLVCKANISPQFARRLFL